MNVVAPYVLTGLIRRPKRLVYLSSSMHRGGRARLTGMDWTGRHETGSYSDNKLIVTALAFAVARRWPDMLSNAVRRLTAQLSRPGRRSVSRAGSPR